MPLLEIYIPGLPDAFETWSRLLSPKTEHLRTQSDGPLPASNKLRGSRRVLTSDSSRSKAETAPVCPTNDPTRRKLHTGEQDLGRTLRRGKALPSQNFLARERFWPTSDHLIRFFRKVRAGEPIEDLKPDISKHEFDQCLGLGCEYEW